MDIFVAPLWNNLPPVFLIKPDNAFFEVFNKKFLTIQRELLGETSSYFYEPLYQVDKKGYNTYLENLGKALSDLLGEFDENAVCYTHVDSISDEFFKKISSKRYIIIDDKESYKTSEFLDGKNFIVSIDGNKYGRTGLYGNVDKVCECPFAKAKEKNPTALGTALSLDTFNENPLYCAVALKAVTASSAFDSESFTEDFAKKRYSIGSFGDLIKKIKNLCYISDECPGSVICARPSTELKHTAPYDTIKRNYDFHELYDITKEILDSDARKNENMRADIQSFVRQILSELAYPVYLKATEFFKEKNISNYEQASNLFLEICEDMDKLLKTRAGTNFYTKIDEARQLGDDKDEKQAIEINYLMLHTVYGPIDRSVLYDTVWREWAGLVKDFYAHRWFMYYKALAAYFDNPKKLKDNSKKQIMDRNEYKGSYQLKRLALFENDFIENYIPRKDGIEDEDTVAVAKEIIEKYSEVIKQF
jgi:alpha-N-acetylglucosaminidase